MQKTLFNTPVNGVLIDTEKNRKFW